MELIDLKGKRFGRLIALEYAGRQKWKCQCDCGKVTVVCGSNLKRGTTRSCRCYRNQRVSETQRCPQGPPGVVYRDYKRNAAKWNRPFEIEFEQFSELIQKTCYYCGKPPSSKCRPVHGDYRYNGLDRVDNKKGYTLDNVVVACAICNRMKDNLSREDFMEGIKAIYGWWYA